MEHDLSVRIAEKRVDNSLCSSWGGACEEGAGEKLDKFKNTIQRRSAGSLAMAISLDASSRLVAGHCVTSIRQLLLSGM